MNDTDLNKKLDQMMETLLGNFDNVHGEVRRIDGTLAEIRKDMQNTKLDLLDKMDEKINAFEDRLVDRLARKDTVEDHERRLRHLETHLN